MSTAILTLSLPLFSLCVALLDRSQRFTGESPSVSRVVSLKTSSAPPPVYKKTELGIGGAKAGSVKGTSQELEREYMRLHWLPDPATVRPAPVLKKALQLVKTKWVSKPDYPHANDQLMAIQQDCKLQGITGNIACDAFGKTETNCHAISIIA